MQTIEVDDRQTDEPSGPSAAGVVFTREQLDAVATVRRFQYVEIQGREGQPLGLVRIRSFSAAEMLQVSVAAADEQANIDLILYVMGVVGEDGEPLYRLLEVTGGFLDGLDAALVRAVANEIDRFTGFSQQAFSTSRVEAAKKN